MHIGWDSRHNPYNLLVREEVGRDELFLESALISTVKMNICEQDLVKIWAYMTFHTKPTGKKKKLLNNQVKNSSCIYSAF